MLFNWLLLYIMMSLYALWISVLKWREKIKLFQGFLFVISVFFRRHLLNAIFYIILWKLAIITMMCKIQNIFKSFNEWLIIKYQCISINQKKYYLISYIQSTVDLVIRKIPCFFSIYYNRIVCCLSGFDKISSNSDQIFYCKITRNTNNNK